MFDIILSLYSLLYVSLGEHTRLSLSPPRIAIGLIMFILFESGVLSQPSREFQVFIIEVLFVRV
jgi:hypothetical protein